METDFAGVPAQTAHDCVNEQQTIFAMKNRSVLLLRFQCSSWCWSLAQAERRRAPRVRPVRP